MDCGIFNPANIIRNNNLVSIPSNHFNSDDCEKQ